jgi:hypothetical protein
MIGVLYRWWKHALLFQAFTSLAIIGTAQFSAIFSLTEPVLWITYVYSRLRILCDHITVSLSVFEACAAYIARGSLACI